MSDLLYQTHAIIHLDHIRDNIAGIRAAIGPDRKILAAVKANAYGHGAVPVARMMEAAGVDWFGVATVPEGIELRQAGIAKPILKMSPVFESEIDAALRHRLTLTVAEEDGARAIQAASARLRAEGAASGPAPVHLKVDTGMGRVGVAVDDAARVATLIQRSCPDLYLEGLFTHFPVSDEADSTYTTGQIARFDAVIAAVSHALGHKPDLVHAANSGAVLGHSAAWYDMVRPGVMLYGHYPDKGTPRSVALKPGMSIHTRVSFIKRVSAGTGVGYGRTWTAPRETVIGTIPVGYADGFNRLFSNRGRVLAGGKSYPVVGRVCMDQSMVDFGPEATVRAGDDVVLMGRQGEAEMSCEEWADLLGTITYEVTCQIGPRVQRVYRGG